MDKPSYAAESWASKTGRTLRASTRKEIPNHLEDNLARNYDQFMRMGKSENAINLCMGTICNIARALGEIDLMTLGSVMDVGIRMESIKPVSADIVKMAEDNRDNPRLVNAVISDMAYRTRTTTTNAEFRDNLATAVRELRPRFPMGNGAPTAGVM